MIIRTVSGAQCGADAGALQAAEELGLPTGGVIPKGFKTQARTYKNVKSAVATIRFAVDLNSPGEICTLNAIKQYNKPHLDIKLTPPIGKPTQASIKRVVDFIYFHVGHLPEEERIINIAGNSNKTWAGMEEAVKAFMLEVLKIIKDKVPNE